MPFGGKTQLTPSMAMVAKLPVLGETTTVSGMAWGFNPYLSSANQFAGAYLAVVESVSRLVAAGIEHRNAYLTFQEYFERLRTEPERWGKPTAAVLGALMAHGVTPGFKIFTTSGELTYTFIFSQFAGNLLMIPVGFLLCSVMAKLLNVKLTFVAVGIVVLSYIGAYAIGNSYMDLWIVVVFGFIGFFGGRWGWDTGAMALGVILGPMIEENLGKCFDLAVATDGGMLAVMTDGSVNKVLIVALILSLSTPFLLKWRNAKNAKKETENA
jgi:hypothetical protein